MKKIFFFLILISSSLLSFGQATPKYSNEFLNIGVGAKSFGMGQSVIAGVDDVTSGYWNPAGLTHMNDKIQVGYMHSNYFGGITNFDYGSVGFKLNEKGAAAISFVRLGVDGIPNTLDLFKNGQLDYSRITEFSAVDYSFLLSYAQKTLIKGLSIGGSAKIVHRKAGQFANAWGFGIDLGAQYETENGWKFAAMARDITTTFNAWRFSFTESEKDVLVQTGNEIPTNSLELTLPRLIIGGGKYFEFSESLGLTAEANLELTTDGRRNVLLETDFVSGDPRLGVELVYYKRIFLRAGLNRLQQVPTVDGTQWQVQPNFGLGLDLYKFNIDYALAGLGEGNISPNTHFFSIRFDINPESVEN